MPLTFQNLLREPLEHRLLALIVFVLCALALDFVFRFCLPGLKLLRSLKRITRSLRAREIRLARQNTSDLPFMVGDAAAEPVFAALWHEYCKTLHPEREIDQVGQQQVSRWRSTVLADTFFTEQAMVNSPLRTEYFKHLPGILTGIGIIGTFRGLIQGLRNFLPSLDPTQMREALGTLIQVVGDAFLTSAAAIILAILFTLIEKILLNTCYRKVEAIQQAIDRLFHPGVGEEYLERLVAASETSATQAIHIKDALVADLKQILTEVTTRQVEASARDSQQISSNVAEVIVKRLGGPIESISEAVLSVGTRQGDALHSALADVLVRISDQIHSTFAAPMSGVQETLAQTMAAMQQTAGRFEQLVGAMDQAAQTSATTMSEKMNAVLTALEAGQQIQIQQSTEVAEQIRQLIAQSQTRNAEKLQQALSMLGEQVVSAVGSLHQQSRETIEHQRQEGKKFVDETVGGLSREVANLVRQSNDTSRSLRESLDLLAKATNDSVTRMNSGAELLYLASSQFAQAGEGVTASANGVSGAIDRIQAATQSLNTAMNGTVGVFEEYKKNRDAFALMVGDLKAAMQNAKKEAFMTSDLVEKLQAAATQLGNAQKQSEDYLGKVNEVLTKTHASFAENLERTLNHGNSRFHVELAKAVDLLAGGIRDLEHAIEMVPVRN